jgi:hypothetical protein
MAAFEYTAKRSLAPGYVVGESCAIALKMRSVSVEGEISRIDQKSMDLSVEPTYFGRKRAWTCQTVAYPPEAGPLIKQFLDSIADGQTFFADVHGSLVATVEFVSVFRTDTSETKERVIQVGGGGAKDWFRYGFNIRET